ncbi:hypothetical protein GCM10010211_83370 [Streptomyces albospinus]|uniref:Uncharacterized protein n=1 Tax=Streptomyces albospinus TaxID=285515 RepID=A0ABQ2VR78_9ACTN|nr:hypothetical protein [Streptomyces albospinus]GGV03432.1 hypothetical protein GCM10010211_83370 [Streptomyces albospinus]
MSVAHIVLGVLGAQTLLIVVGVVVISREALRDSSPQQRPAILTALADVARALRGRGNVTRQVPDRTDPGSPKPRRRLGG